MVGGKVKLVGKVMLGVLANIVGLVVLLDQVILRGKFNMVGLLRLLDLDILLGQVLQFLGVQDTRVGKDTPMCLLVDQDTRVDRGLVLEQG